MPDIQTDILNQSVTKNDYSTNGGMYYFYVGARNMFANFPPSLEGLGMVDSDLITQSTIDYEAIWAGAVAIAITKVSSLAWEIEGDIPLRTKRGQELLLGIDAGRGWVSGMSKLLQDFLLTNNGAFLENVRATPSENSPTIGLIPLDSLRCTRTGDPSNPVIYRDLKGAMHQLRAADVIEFADMPSSRASMFGSGRCAAYRAYKSIYKLAAIEQYTADKVTGRRPLAIELINGLNDPQLRSLLTTGQSDADARGMVSYMGVILGTAQTVSLSHVTIPLSGLPDNFDRQKELDITVLAYANNLGLDVQDLQPLTGRALGTGAQSEVLNEKAKGKGLAAFRQQFTHALNQWVLPDATTFVFTERDWRDKQLQAQINSQTAMYVGDSVSKGILTGQQGLQALVDAEVYPDEFLPADDTPDTTLADDEKQEDPNAVQPEAAPVAEPVIPEPIIPPVPPAGKSKQSVALLKDQSEAAKKLVKKIKGKVNA
jgi:hypothetical protein